MIDYEDKMICKRDLMFKIMVKNEIVAILNGLFVKFNGKYTYEWDSR